MASEFDALLAAPPDVVERERLLAIYMIRAEKLLEAAEELRSHWIEALEAAAGYDQLAERLARWPVERLTFDSAAGPYVFPRAAAAQGDLSASS